MTSPHAIDAPRFSQNSYRTPPTKQFRNVVRHAAGDSSPPNTEKTAAAITEALARAPGPARSGTGDDKRLRDGHVY